MSTDAPAAPVATKKMSDAHKAAMKKGREDRAALDKRLSDTDKKLDTLSTQFLALMERLSSAPLAGGSTARHEDVTLTATPMLAAAPPSETPSASRQVEAAYVVTYRVGKERKRENREITDPDDARWEGELMESPFNGDPRGAMEVATVLRVDGEVVKKEAIFGGGAWPMNKARNFIREFAVAKAAGSRAPWDQERFYRESKEEAERAKREGRVEELVQMRELLVMALKGVVDAKAAS